jgi:transcription initiation factor TFIIF subunit alpha
MRFGSSQNVDPTKWKSTKMYREITTKELKTETDEEFKEFGAGSEFGKKQKEESKRKKFMTNNKKQSQQPWILKVGGKQPKK